MAALCARVCLGENFFFFMDPSASAGASSFAPAFFEDAFFPAGVDVAGVLAGVLGAAAASAFLPDAPDSPFFLPSAAGFFVDAFAPPALAFAPAFAFAPSRKNPATHSSTEFSPFKIFPSAAVAP